MGNKTIWWILLFLWMGGATWWHVCKVKQLCYDKPDATAAISIPGLDILDGDALKLSALGNFSFARSGATANWQAVQPELDSLATYLKANPGKKITVTGLYDANEQNETSFANLGLARADGIKQFLVKASGLPDSLFVTDSREVSTLVFNAAGDSLYGGIDFGFANLVPVKDPEAEKLAAAEKYEDIFKPMDLYFATGSSDYIHTPDNQQFLTEATQYLAKNKDKKLVLTGHTDNVGGDDTNLRLSEKRANAVKEQFVKAGMATEQLSVTAKGESEPQADNNTPEGRKANRRVAIVVQ
jgi:OmpA-OmpF porin, OOP family